MNRKRRGILFLLVLCCLTLLLTVTASAAEIVDSGSCGADGDNVTWSLDSDGVLTISGNGKMMDWAFADFSPFFKYCSNIESVIIKPNVTSIGSYAFGCWNSNSYTQLKSITIPDSVTAIGSSAFSGCDALTEISIPDSMTAIGDSAFSSCSALIEITIPDSVTAIGNWAFSSCSALTEITIPDSVTAIGDYAFCGCTALTEISIPDSVTAIGNYTFSSCSALTEITIPDSVTAIGESAFYNCSKLTDVYLTDMDAWCRISFGNASSNPMYCAKNVYLNKQKVADVTVPEGVTTLQYTFYNFPELIRVTLPEGLTNIGDNTFYNCTSLTKVNIPQTVVSIGSDAFYGCSGLSKITLPDGLTAIGSSAFYNCSGLTSIEVPDKITAIESYTFSSCSKLTDVKLPDGLTSIGSYAFYSCKSLQTINLPDTVTTIDDRAFHWCSSLKSVDLPDQLISLGCSAFGWCDSLTSVSIPAGVTSIGGSAFEPSLYKSCLKEIYITDLSAWCKINFGNANANPLWNGGALYLNGVKLTALEIPSDVTVISPYTFRNNTSIEQVAIPKTLIGVSADAFSGCTGIKQVFYEGSEEEWEDLAISSGNEPLTNAEIFYNSTLTDYYCRITVSVSDGGTLGVSSNAVKKDETVTVTATPYAGYQLEAIYVDGTAIEGNSFTATGNHTVSASFTLIHVTGGTTEYKLDSITVKNAAGEKVQTLPQEKMLVTISITQQQAAEGATIMLAQYDSNGRYQGLAWVSVEEMPEGSTVRVTLPVDNRSGSIASLKAFVVSSLTDPTPIGNAVSYGSV